MCSPSRRGTGRVGHVVRGQEVLWRFVCRTLVSIPRHVVYVYPEHDASFFVYIFWRVFFLTLPFLLNDEKVIASLNRMNSYKRKRRNVKRKTKRAKSVGLLYLLGGDDKCIFVKMHGGLGNQLFVYAAGLVAKKKLGLPICLLPAAGSVHTQMNYRQKLFSNVKSISNSDPGVKGRMNASTMILQGVPGAHGKWSNRNITANITKNVQLSGGWLQNYTAIKDIIPEMRQQVMGALQKEFPDFKATIDSETSAFMHVRRGDYEHLGQALPKSYYQNALNEVSKLDNLKKIYLLSNDMDWCKNQNFTVGQGMVLEPFEERNELKTMYLMGLCKRAAIISASTFSTWGAIFGAETAANPVILYPTNWLNQPSSSVLEFPADKGWKTISS